MYVSKFVLTSSFLDFSKYITRISIIYFDSSNYLASVLKLYSGLKNWRDNKVGTTSWFIVIGEKWLTFHWKGPDRWQDIPSEWWRHHGDPPDPVSAGRLTKYWSVSSAGRPDGIDFQTNVDWISTKMNDAQQVPRGYLLRPSWHHVLFAFMYSPRAGRFRNRDFRLESPSLLSGRNLFHPSWINYGAVTNSADNKLVFALAYTS